MANFTAEKHSICEDINENVPFMVTIRPVGTNLILVRRGCANINNLLSMKAERAKREERLTAWDPGARLKAPGGGPGGRAPGSSWVLAFVKGPERLSWNFFFFKSTYRSACQWYRNVSIK